MKILTSTILRDLETLKLNKSLYSPETYTKKLISLRNELTSELKEIPLSKKEENTLNSEIMSLI